MAIRRKIYFLLPWGIFSVGFLSLGEDGGSLSLLGGEGGGLLSVIIGGRRVMKVVVSAKLIVDWRRAFVGDRRGGNVAWNGRRRRMVVFRGCMRLV